MCVCERVEKTMGFVSRVIIYRVKKRSFYYLALKGVLALCTLFFFSTDSRVLSSRTLSIVDFLT